MAIREERDRLTGVENVLKTLIDLSKQQMLQERQNPPARRARPKTAPEDASLAGRVIALDYGTHVEYTSFEHDGTIHVERHNNPFHHRRT